MKKIITKLQNGLLALLATTVFCGGAVASTDVKFSLDWKFEGPSALFFTGLERGYYAASGLNVTIDSGKGSLDAIPKVASGTYPIGFADINSLVKFKDKNAGAKVIGIMMIYDAPPFAIIGRKSLGVSKPKDLEGKILGAPAPDGAYAQWKSFVLANGINASKVTIENVGFPVREPMLAQGKVHAITGFSFSSYINLKSKGVPASDISLMLMTENGLDLYGNSVIVNTDYAQKNPEVVKGFLNATLMGIRDVVADPAATVKYVIKYNNVAREPVEHERLEMALRDNVVTNYVSRNGIGGIDRARFQRAIKQLGQSYTFTRNVTVDEVFTEEYLPTKANRMIN
jgi:NitT/TauT family transport system substrate-binding protein